MPIKSGVIDTRGQAVGDILVLGSGTSKFVRLAQGSIGQQLTVRYDGTLAYTTAPHVDLKNAWGIVADGKLSTTAGTPVAGSTTFATPTGVFSVLDVGKLIAMPGVGASGEMFVSTITGYSQGAPNDTITMAAAPTYGDGSAAYVWWGTDNTTVLQTAINSIVYGYVELPIGMICYQGPLNFNITATASGTQQALTFAGQGSGYSKWTGATLLVNFSRDEALIASYVNLFDLNIRRMHIKQLCTFAGSGIAGVVYLTNQYGGGGLDQVHIESAENPAGDQWTGTFSTTAATITGLGTSLRVNGRSTIRVGDSVYGPAVAANTTITAISPSTGTVTMSNNGTQSGSFTFAVVSSNTGHGLWLDNPQAPGGQRNTQVRCTNFGAGDGFRLSAQIYSTTGITGNVTNGSKTITGITNFAGWFPGGTATVTSGTGAFPAGSLITQVNRAAGTATINANATTTGTVTMTIAGNGLNSGNVTYDACFASGCLIAFHAQGAAGTGGLLNGCTLNSFKTVYNVISSNITNNAQPPLSKGIYLEGAEAQYTINAPHIEGHFYGIHLSGAQGHVINAPLLSCNITGTRASEVKTGIRMDTSAYGNRIQQPLMLGAQWNTWVYLDSTTSGNRILDVVPYGSTVPTNQYYTDLGTNNVLADMRCPHEMVYKQITSGVTVAATGTTTVISATSSVFCDGGPLLIEFWSPYAVTQSGQELQILFQVDGTTVSQMSDATSVSTSVGTPPVHALLRYTPSAGNHTFGVIAQLTTSTGTAIIGASTGTSTTQAPAFLRVTKAQL